ncbi:hypothetical protein UA75_28495 [Actinoalloteichus sp. GBA129-24]|uniref:Uncharacterized protein n=1 Tax=Actinoalloteichus fjordicus TaxID=1612552 RepID=A0AAC9LJW0_9PSEU|nr:hypothetical protein UA74_27965 [Actinoalloteichus fjordicus]APU23670.1 hypothetical protein UA75_28495 [Actinoalloteichus sp. GBA129-24]
MACRQVRASNSRSGGESGTLPATSPHHGSLLSPGSSSTALPTQDSRGIEDRPRVCLRSLLSELCGAGAAICGVVVGHHGSAMALSSAWQLIHAAPRSGLQRDRRQTLSRFLLLGVPDRGAESASSRAVSRVASDVDCRRSRPGWNARPVASVSCVARAARGSVRVRTRRAPGVGCPLVVRSGAQQAAEEASGVSTPRARKRGRARHSRCRPASPFRHRTAQLDDGCRVTGASAGRIGSTPRPARDQLRVPR